MDNLTHALVGATIGRAGAERTTPLATPTLVIAANAPDVDVLSYVGGSYAALAFRRGITHGVPALLLWPFIVTAGVLAFDRWVRRSRRPELDPVRAGPTLVWSTVGVWTHPALDWMNIYGMRWWMPFDGTWTYGDVLFIIDPWIWLLLGGAILLSRRQAPRSLLRWTVAAVLVCLAVAFGVGARTALVAAVAASLFLIAALLNRTTNPFSPGESQVAPPRVALTAVAIYVVMMMAADVGATADVRRAAEEAGLVVEDVMVAPEPAVPTRSAVEVVTPTSIIAGTHSWLATPRTQLDTLFDVPREIWEGGLTEAEAQVAIATAMTVPQAADFLTWSRFPYVGVVRRGDSTYVRFSDARYDDRGGGGGLDGVTIGPMRPRGSAPERPR